MNLLDTLTRAADEEQLRLKPLPEHAAATQTEHLRRHYALLLAAVLTAQPTISEPQTRLLRLLLDALKLGDIRGTLFEQARALEAETLLEAARLIREAGLAHHLVVDVLVLLRLDAPLSDEAARLVGELAAFLALDANQLATRAQDAAEILGLNLRPKAEEEGGTDVGENEGEGAEPPPLHELWPGRLRQPLTAAALRQGLQGGLWIVDADLAVHFCWQAKDAVLVFRNGATLNTFAEEGKIKLEGCRLVDAVLTFQGKNSVITLERCDWQGNYATPQRTALVSVGQALTVSACAFSTQHARAILVEGCRLTLTDSRFTRCGYGILDGGAVWHSDNDRTIRNCLFDRCFAARGGAIAVDTLYGVDKCEFVACRSLKLELMFPSAGDVAVYADKAKAPTAISDCVFRKTSLVIGSAFDGSGARFVRSCRFQQGDVYYHNRCLSNHITDACSFDGGREIERRF